MPSILFNQAPGTTWTNETEKVRFQFICNWVHTCGICAQYDHAIGSIWPIPLHRGCACRQEVIAVGATSQPFVDYQEHVSRLDRRSQSLVMGRSNYELVTKGVIKWEDVVTPTRIRRLQEVVSREKLTIDQMTRAGVRRTLAERAYEAVHTPAQQLLQAQRKELIANLEHAGLKRSKIIDLAAKGLAEKVGIKGPSGEARVKIGAGQLGELLQKLQIRTAILNTPKIAAKPRIAAKPVETSKPYDFEAIGEVPADLVEQFERWVGELPPEALAKIKDNNGKFVYAQRIEAYDSTLAAERPRGWPDDASWKNVDGIYDPKKKHIVVAREHLDPDTLKYTKNDRQKGVLYHETGHGLDHAAGNASNTPAFTAAHLADVEKLSHEAKAKLTYFTQAGGSGEQETFAEVFANLHGESSQYGETIDQHFPSFADLTKRFLANLKAKK